MKGAEESNVKEEGADIKRGRGQECEGGVILTGGVM